MFAEVDADGSGAIDRDELREALFSLKVYLSNREVQDMVDDIDVDRNGTIERDEWERGIVLAKYQIYLHLAMANKFLQYARKEYLIAGADDKEKLCFDIQQRIDKMTPISERERMLGCLWGVVSGDALAMPGDGSINLKAQHRDYGLITTLQPPYMGTHADGGMHLGINSTLKHLGKDQTRLHPRAILDPHRKSNIMGGKDRFHDQRGVHPHRCLKEGNNTLTAQITSLLIRSISENGLYNRDHFLDLYISHMQQEPDKDVYIDSYHIE